jgi:hypothetical protein
MVPIMKNRFSPAEKKATLLASFVEIRQAVQGPKYRLMRFVNALCECALNFPG